MNAEKALKELLSSKFVAIEAMIGNQLGFGPTDGLTEAQKSDLHDEAEEAIDRWCLAESRTFGGYIQRQSDLQILLGEYWDLEERLSNLRRRPYD